MAASKEIAGFVEKHSWLTGNLASFRKDEHLAVGASFDAQLSKETNMAQETSFSGINEFWLSNFTSSSLFGREQGGRG